jgi:hypothetical protein
LRGQVVNAVTVEGGGVVRIQCRRDARYRSMDARTGQRGRVNRRLRRTVWDVPMFGHRVSLDIEYLFRRGLLIDLAQKAQPLGVTVRRLALGDHLTVQHIERLKQGRRAVAFVVVRNAPFLYRTVMSRCRVPAS